MKPVDFEKFAAQLDYLEAFANDYNPDADEGQQLLAELAEALLENPHAPALDYHQIQIAKKLVLAHLGEPHKIGPIWTSFIRDCLHRLDAWEAMRLSTRDYHRAHGVE
ncbi:hypothetical protein THIX_60988 [Thiomonas sp. X19]|uniref:hypothetical protein n=1 Tax=Thiomonas sp. X19 TaxID=1050370 RepID=UPI000B67EDAD|nr:hypothetical protein [Thiomonas sp. X19]SCC94930.1 hypothetical protein THIX_60988 [Thiomonas sp. X19]